MIKLYINSCWDPGTNYQAPFDYYDLFLRLSKYEKIKIKHFAKKPLQETIRKKKTCRGIDDIENFGRDDEECLLDSD